ncbi:peptidase [Citricoccus sp. SGAir0253]|uniref:S8 family serine peptidase n=1 Tax=Citricoccus sp. SGAir0253 TaxID=2567881 RepID=UPI0010CD5002|nr:S8 family serine peptidase [Citricoccus sp. SGAir0253]QCU79032.1 peptidase [Citricoccus sp. SGAir0253]
MTRNPRRSRLRRALTAGLAGLGLLAAPLAALPAAAAPSGGSGDGAAAEAAVEKVLRDQAEYRDGRYFVVLKEDPLATYRGGTKGLPATAATDGEIDVRSDAARKYDRHLTARQLEVAASTKVRVQRHFTTALNAFVSELTADEARALAKDPRVLGVSEVEQFHPDYSSTEFLGLPGSTGAWNTQYGGVEDAGKGVVVGVIDTGYYPDQEMLAGEPVQPLSGEPRVGEPYLTEAGEIAMLKADGTTFRGDCQTGQGFTGDECNSKVLSARYYSEDFEAFVPAEQRDPRERLSPVDIDSHGTHTATTAAGNQVDDQVMNGGASYGPGSGVAPAAKVSVYKVCWEDKDPDTGGCYGTASVAAIEQAIIDGVDVLNYSISGNNSSIVDPVALAFKSAAEAGIFVAASAGNSGPAPQTVNHSAPWLTSVAASTFSNELTGTVEFPDGTRFRGVSSMAEGVGPADIVLASEVGLAGKTADQVRLCDMDALDPAKATGKIVVCDRGVYARVDKSAAVEKAGGVGMVLVNIGGGSEDADLHAVPTVHTSDESIKEHVASTDAQATLVKGDTTGLEPVPVPQIAGFSSRGPSTAVGSELLKPDLAAPGVNVLAGVSPLNPQYDGDTFGLMSGTSMAAPNVAGMAALMGGKYPEWSPMAVKSAMMTSAADVLTAQGESSTDNFATGAGSADPEEMTAPSLVFEADAKQWDALILGELPGREVNVPSVAVSDLLGSETVTRTVTATETGAWEASGSVPGYEVSVEPSTFELDKGQSREVAITFTRTTAAAATWAHGSYTLAKPGATPVTAPVSLRAVDAKAPAAVTGEGSSGSATVEVTPGITGTLDPVVEGLAPAEIEEFTKTPGKLYGGENPSNHPSAVEVPAGATEVSWALDAADEESDWDLYVVTPSEEVVQQATAAGSESLVIEDPEPGTYYAVANLYSSPGGAPADATLRTVVQSGDAGNLTVSPDPLEVTRGQDATATLTWSGLTPGVWMGSVTWAEGSSTAVTVTVVGPGAPACEAADFADNRPGSVFYAEVRWMQCAGITTGYADGTYRKPQAISRGQSVAFLYRYLDPGVTGTETGFDDVPPTHPFATAISWAATEGITTGYRDGTFRPEREVTRAEFASFLHRAIEPTSLGEQDAEFSDVSTSSTHYEAITWMASEGITRGYKDGTFRPNAPITRGEAAAFMARTDAVVTE